MECDKYKPMIMEYLDGELDESVRGELESHLARCSACRRELESMRKVKDITSQMQFTQPEEEVWKMYWEQVYNRFERGLGWIFFSLGAIIFLAYGAFDFIEDFLRNPDEPLGIKIAVSSVILGLVILFVSVLRERLFIRKTDKYKEIER